MLMMGEERKLTKTAAKNREAYAKELKKGGRMKYFKDKYGKDAEDVVYATATNMAFDKLGKPTEFLKKARKKLNKEEEVPDEIAHNGDLEGTPERTRKYKRYTPGQVNEIADKYFTEGDSK
jgi:hypothetical protein